MLFAERSPRNISDFVQPTVQGGPKKTGPDNFCNNFVYCQTISIIFDTYTLQKICNQKMYS